MALGSAFANNDVDSWLFLNFLNIQNFVMVLMVTFENGNNRLISFDILNNIPYSTQNEKDLHSTKH